ncbi:MAG: amino acid/amide transporter substrate-binding protein family [Polaromonas sp.]|nr:amino acid/amide transporter substrate-binding protein family [Polaromonas sp.]
MKKILLAIACASALGSHPAAFAAKVVVGQVGPMSGTDATQARAYGAGMELVFAAINKAGGANGNTFVLVRKNDGGRAEDTVGLTKELLAEEKPLVLSGFFGTRNVGNVVASGLLEKENIALVGYRTAEVRPETPMLYSVRATLRDEINKLTTHLSTIGITRIGLLYEESPSAPALLAAAEEAGKAARVNITTKASYPLGTSKIAPAVEVFVKSQPQAIIMVTSGSAAAAFIDQYRSAGGAAQLFTHSGADIEQLSKRLTEDQIKGVAIAQVTPSPYKISGQLAKEFSDIVAKTPNLEEPVSYAMMEGYIAAKVIVEAVRRSGRQPTRESIVSALDAMQSYDLGGYLVGFKPGQHSGSKFVELSIISGSGKIRQ